MNGKVQSTHSFGYSVEEINGPNNFGVGLDLFSGNSGSLVFNVKTGALDGVALASYGWSTRRPEVKLPRNCSTWDRHGQNGVSYENFPVAIGISQYTDKFFRT